MSDRKRTLEEEAAIHDAAEARLPALNQASFGRYQDIRFHRDGGTGFVYLAERVFPGEEPERVVIKTDKPRELMTSHRAWRHTERHNDVMNELRMRRLLGDIPGVNTPFDWIDLTAHGYGYAKVELYRDGQTLEELIAPDERGKGTPMDVPTFRKLFRKLLRTEQQVLARGVFLRDTKPSNIQVDLERGDLWLIDHGNATHASELEAKLFATAGGQKIMDPITVAGFTPETPQYSLQSELYALGIDMLLALTGRYQFDYDSASWEELERMGQRREDVLERRMLRVIGGPLSAGGEEEYRLDGGYWNHHDARGVRRGVRLDNYIETHPEWGPTLLDVDGNLDVAAHERALHDVLCELPYDTDPTKDAKRYGTIIRKLLTVKKKERYGSIEEVIADFEAAGGPGWTRRHAVKIFGGVALAALAAVSGGLLATRTEREGRSAEASAATALAVATDWNYDTIELSNDLVEVEFDAVNLTRIDRTDTRRILRASPGDTINPRMTVRLLPGKRATFVDGGIKGSFYFEGYGAERFSVVPRPHNESEVVDMWQIHHYESPNEIIILPTDLGPGTYTLVGELYAPEEGVETEMRFGSPGTAIARSTISVVVGEAESAVRPSSIVLRSNGSIYFGMPGRTMGREPLRSDPATYEIAIPETGYRTDGRFETDSRRVSFEKPTVALEQATLQFVLRDHDGNPIHAGWLPLRGTDDGRGPSTIVYYQLRNPEPGFSDRLVELREELQKEQR